jgi:hypothetical protein
LHIHELQKIGPERILQKRPPEAAPKTGPRGFLIEGIVAIAAFRGLFSFFGSDFLGRHDSRFFFGMGPTAAISFRGQNLNNAWFVLIY